MQKALDARLTKLPKIFSLSELLDTWEMSVRQASAPKTQITINSGLSDAHGAITTTLTTTTATLTVTTTNTTTVTTTNSAVNSATSVTAAPILNTVSS